MGLRRRAHRHQRLTLMHKHWRCVSYFFASGKRLAKRLVELLDDGVPLYFHDSVTSAVRLLVTRRWVM